MIISKKGRYAVRAVTVLASLAGDQGGGPIKLARIAEEEKLPIMFIEQIFNKLKKSGILQSIKGPGGGYVLAVSPEELTVHDIVLALGEYDEISECDKSAEEKPPFSICSECYTRHVWNRLEELMKDYLKTVTISSLVEQRRRFFDELKKGIPGL